MNRIFDEHRKRNKDSRQRWECFAAHRRQVTELLLAADASGRGRLCVLGAGNCNDLDLPSLSAAYAEVHLVDLDAEALENGVATQSLSSNKRIHQHGGVDLMGGSAIAGDWTPEQSPADTDVQRCLELVATHPSPQLPGPFDVVASVCLLTQLLDSMALSLGGDHPRFLELVTSIRLRHVRLLCELLRPSGTAILITDFVSSATHAPLATTSDRDLPALAAQLINARNFFTGANPAVLHELFKTDAVIAPQISHLEVSRPWLWDFGPRVYAVCAITARSRAGD